MGIFNRKRPEDRKENPYLGLRKMAFDVKPEMMNIEKSQSVAYGIIAEFIHNGVPISITYFISGDTSMYTGNGGGFLGAGQHPEVADIVRKAVENANHFLGKGVSCTTSELPEENIIKFNLLTTDGLQVIQESMSSITSKKSSNYVLFNDMNVVMAHIRMKSQTNL